MQLGLGVPAEIHAAGLKDDLRLILLVDGPRLLLGQHPLVTVQQFGPGGEGRQVGGKAAFLLD